MEIASLLTPPKTIAVIGLSENPERPSYKVASYLHDQGFTIIPVNPNISSWNGIKAYPSFSAIPVRVSIDIVDIFRKSDEVLEIVQEILVTDRRPILWMQEGVRSLEAQTLAESAGMGVIMDACIMKKHQAMTQRKVFMEQIQPQPTDQVIPAPVQQSHDASQKSDYRFVIVIGFFCVVLTVCIGFIGFLIGTRVKQTDQRAISDSSAAPESEKLLTAPTFSPPPTQSPDEQHTYTYKTFSIQYPKDWKMFDSQTDADFFSPRQLSFAERSVVFEKKGYMLLISIDAYKPGMVAESGFFNPIDEQKMRGLSSLVRIADDSKEYYLSTGHIALSTVTDPNEEVGLLGRAALSEYVPNMGRTESGEVFSGVRYYIQNKNGYSYLFVKIARSASVNDQTPADIQKEMVEILETIRW